MSACTLSDYASALARSQLCNETAQKQACDDYLRATAPAQRSAQGLADFVAERGLATPWQNAQLLQGRFKGFLLGKYKLLDQLGRGGMAGVYLAEDTLILRRVALKILPQSHASGPTSHLARFQREAKALAMLQHRNIVRVYDIDVHDGMHYIAMEYIQGVDLERLVGQRGPLSECEAADYIGQAAAGLAHAHERKLIHRDIKPANLLLDQQGTIKLLDLGVARFGDDESSLTVLHDDRMLGTADFIAPEQALNSHNVGPSADVYSLGCTLHFVLTGRAPFHEGTAAERLLAHQMKEPPELNAQRRKAGAPPIDERLAELCRRMLAKQPHERPTPAELIEQLPASVSAVRHPAIESTASAPAAKPPQPHSAAPSTNNFSFVDTRAGSKPAAAPVDHNRRRPTTKGKTVGARTTLLLVAAAGVLVLGALGAGGAVIAYQLLQPNTVESDSPTIAASSDKTPSDEPIREVIEPLPRPLVTSPSASPLEAPNATRYYVVGTSNKYHRASCRYVTGAAREIDAVEARASYQPCKVCKPDQ